jgi:prophage DNA circulation protein
MFKEDAQEAAPIMQRAIASLLRNVPIMSARSDLELELPRAELRRACGYLILNAEMLIQTDAAGEPLDECFDLAVKASIGILAVRRVRDVAEAEAPQLVGALLIKNSIIRMTLATEARLIRATRFVSRDDVDALRLIINDAFGIAEQIAADDMDQMTYRALVELHAAIIFYLVETARPLPRMLTYRFALSMPSVTLAYRLYADAGRADELRAENKVVHPAFMPREGRGLSA